MKIFIIKTALFTLLVAASTYVFSLKAGGYTDPFYRRFTSPRQTSLILGTSRSAQGLLPEVINTVLGRTDVYNYSFTVLHSPYGPVYLNSITKKLRSQTKNGVFILSVDPWSVSSDKLNPNDSASFKEAGLALGTTTYVNYKPNLHYLVNNFDHFLYKTFLQSKNEYVHPDGWLEVSVNMDTNEVAKRLKNKVQDYTTNMLAKLSISPMRLKYLISTITFLQQYGKVYLVRLPANPLIMAIDNQFDPQFNNRMSDISSKQGVPFLDLTYLNASMRYTDGNHLYKESGKIVSKIVAEWIKRQ